MRSRCGWRWRASSATTTAPHIRASGTGRSGQPIHRLRGQTIGIVSFGKIGQAIAARAKAFGVESSRLRPFHRRTKSLPRTAPPESARTNCSPGPTS